MDTALGQLSRVRRKLIYVPFKKKKKKNLCVRVRNREWKNTRWKEMESNGSDIATEVRRRYNEIYFSIEPKYNTFVVVTLVFKNSLNNNGIFLSR